ncbi:uncharacterized protein LOC143295470 [Babylonia areolata]|uniref:uncharacterized protein LOC143295470 n=1 Tax=Babylonia areolata TaxID=304850 RepID=UPI003FD0C920
MDYHLIPVYSPADKKRKLSEDAIDSRTDIEYREHSRQFLSIPRSEHVFQTEDWRSGDSALFLPLTEDLLVNVRKVEQVSCSEGHYFVADAGGKYSRSLPGKVIHFWRYDKIKMKLYVSRSFLFTALQEFQAVQRFLQTI